MKKLIKKQSPIDNAIITKKKNTLIQKLNQYFNLKHKKLLQETNFPRANVSNEIATYLESFENTKVDEYSYIINNIEKILLDKIKNFNEENLKENFSRNKEIPQISTNTAEASSSRQAGSLPQNEEYRINATNSHHQRSQSVTKGFNNVFQNQKLINLKERTNDEWALIAKFNHLKFLEEEKNSKMLKEEKKNLLKQSLESQMLEKNKQRKLKQDEDRLFFIRQNNKLNNLKEEEFARQKEKLELKQYQKEYHEKIINGILFYFYFILFF